MKMFEEDMVSTMSSWRMPSFHLEMTTPGNYVTPVGMASNNTHADHWMFIYVFPALKISVAFFIFIANGLIMAAIGLHKSLRKAPYYYIGSLAMADTCVGIQIVLCNIIYRYLLYRDKYACLSCVYFSVVALKMSATSLVCLTLERFAKINFPLHHSLYLKNSRIKKSVAILWTFYAGMCLVWLMLKNNFEEDSDQCLFVKIATMPQLGFAFSVTLLEIIIITVLNLQIFFVVWRNQRGRGVSVTRHTSSADSMKHNFRLVKMMSIVIGVLYTTWLPSIVVGIYDMYYQGDQERGLAFLIAREFSIVVLYCNSLVNPFIYHYQNIHFRRAFNKLLFRRKSVELGGSDGGASCSSPRLRRHFEMRKNSQLLGNSQVIGNRGVNAVAV